MITVQIMKKYLSFLIIVSIFTFLTFLPLVQAQTNPGGQTITGNPSDCESGKLCNPLRGVSTIQDFIRIVLEGALKIGIPIIALAIIYSGFLFVKARGNPEEITKAKDALLYTLIGAGVLLGAWAIAKLIADTVFSLS